MTRAARRRLQNSVRLFPIAVFSADRPSVSWTSGAATFVTAETTRLKATAPLIWRSFPLLFRNRRIISMIEGHGHADHETNARESRLG